MLLNVAWVLFIQLKHQIGNFGFSDRRILDLTIFVLSQLLQLVHQIGGIQILDCVDNRNSVLAYIFALYSFDDFVHDQLISSHNLSVNDSAA